MTEKRGSYKIEEPSEISRTELESMARIHREELGDGFISGLGDRMLELLFRSGCSGNAGIVMLAREGATGNVVGFLMGTRDTGRFYREYLVKNFFRTCWVLLPRICSFYTLRRIFESLLYPKKKMHKELPVAELLDIAVTAEHHGNGIGRQLFCAYAGALANEGIPAFKITTGESLRGAQEFYTKLGARFVRWVQVHAGSKTAVYVYQQKLDPSSND